MGRAVGVTLDSLDHAPGRRRPGTPLGTMADLRQPWIVPAQDHAGRHAPASPPHAAQRASAQRDEYDRNPRVGARSAGIGSRVGAAPGSISRTPPSGGKDHSWSRRQFSDMSSRRPFRVPVSWLQAHALAPGSTTYPKVPAAIWGTRRTMKVELVLLSTASDDVGTQPARRAATARGRTPGRLTQGAPGVRSASSWTTNEATD